MLDCYMGRTIRENYSHAITTRTATDNNTFVMEVYEDAEDTAGNEERIHRDCARRVFCRILSDKHDEKGKSTEGGRFVRH